MNKISTRTGSRPGSAAEPGCGPTKRKLSARATKPYAALFKALGDEARLEIVGLLAAEGKELCVCEIESHFDLSQPTVSHHLRVLRHAGVVTAERRGTWVYYALDRAVLAKLADVRALLEG